MPLLHRKPFVRQKPPLNLKPTEEVFLCKVTNEIFRDYDEFFERTILCNSLVWSCAITGKPGLTYQEALECEKRARQNLQSFPEPLIMPLLYLTTLTRRSRLHDICDDVFTYVKDRFFAGETVDVISTNGTRQPCKILEVLSPRQNGTVNGHIKPKTEGDSIIISDDSEDEGNTKATKSPANNGKKKAVIKPSLFKYKVQPIKVEGCEPIIVKTGQINRKKNMFSRERLKLLLKQHCEPQNGVIGIKTTSITKYKLLDQNFFSFFPDEPPTFVFSPASKGRCRPASGQTSHGHSGNATDGEHTPRRKNQSKDKAAKEAEKLQKQKEEMKAMALEKAKLRQEKSDNFEAKKREKEDKEKKKEELKKLVEVERLKKKEEKDRLKAQKEKEREKLREEKRKYTEYLKQWNKRREDMECDDLKELPTPLPVKTRLPPEFFGDALMVLEFLQAFGELFDLQDEFPEGVTLEVLEEALVGSDPEGPLCELLFFFMSAIFMALAEEQEDVAREQLAEADTKDLTEALDEDADPTQSAISAVASLAAAWPQLYQGCSLKQLDLDSCTLSEILRLHILASGADVTSANAKYRYQKQGGFDSMDDACVELRLCNPGLIKKLSTIPVYDLLPGEKLKILHALCGKLLTLVSTRDFIEDNADILRQAKQEFRELKAEQHRREREEAAARFRKKKEEKLKEQELKMKEKHEKLKEYEQRSGRKENTAGEEEQEEMDTSTESHEGTQKEMGQDTATEDEEESEPKTSKKKKSAGRRESPKVNGTESKETLSPEEEEALRKEQAKKEGELLERIQKAAVCTYILPLGRDRLYRRYWLFPSAPALFVEEDYSGLTEDMLLPNDSGAAVQGPTLENKDPRDPVTTPVRSGQATSTSAIVNSTQQSSKPVDKPNLWAFYNSPEQLEQLIEALNTRGRRESGLKEALLQEKTRITKMLSSCPTHRFHIPDTPQAESKLVSGKSKGAQITQNTQLTAVKHLETRLKDLLLDIEDRIYQGTLGAVKVKERQAWKNALESGQYELLSNEIKENGIVETENGHMEEMGVDEVNMKVGTKDRLLELKSECQSTASTSTSTPQPVNNAVHYLALALSQIEQGIERKFLKPPLGDEDLKKDQKGKRKEDKKKKDEDQSSEKDDASDSGRVHKTVLDRWRESLSSCSSLSQVFLHLSTLDRSIMWSKSILNARCKMCRKKGDAENMLLCDGCDRGHHIYCIRPKLKTIPQGDWFCPECRPKQRSRRLSSRQRSSVDSDEEQGPESKEEEEDEEEEQTEDEEEDEEEGESEDEEYDDDEESLPKKRQAAVKLPLNTKGGKSNTPSTGRGSQRQPESGRSTPRNQQSTSKQTTSTGKGGSKSSGKKGKATPASENRPPSRPGSRSSSRLSLELKSADNSFTDLSSSRSRASRGKKTVENTPESSPALSRSSKNNSSRGTQPIVLPQESEVDRRGRKRQATDAADQIAQVKAVVPPPVPSNRRSSGRNYGVHELSACEQLVVELVRHEDSWPFMKLVSRTQVPDYYDVIQKPIALNIIREKVNSCEYSMASDFIGDVELMFANCMEYNPRNTNEAKAGVRLQAFFHSQAQKLGVQIKSADQIISPPTKRSRM
ncbi:bromodomain adjacent to zinc finger domain protein 1A-like [Polyodon spathula]|uniref:bromodomain adjacent to zinc finger domain protein 1A-like n=1 Tax=Polyodon spathula TaxID=7913 RepID=UPI001B7DB64F|nr:bromodomain adjacent to zinc finger domain protein 1A-like [Polyodon spathula]XP_041122291.1 bromodomain adjacent to zinc finger domain protein 1A-like [Polyodon spathula]